MAEHCIMICVHLLFVLLFRSCYGGLLNLEELKNIHYSIDIINDPVVENSKDVASIKNAIQVTSKYGQHYLCGYPDRSDADKKKEEEEKVALETGIPELLKPLETANCLYKHKDWWSYEFCYGKFIKQFHIEDGKVVGEVTLLGSFESDYDWTEDEKNIGMKSKNKIQRYHSQSYVNGTKCDLTGKPRKTEVRFVCEEHAADVISRIDEPETCSYVIYVQTKRVCNHPFLRPPAKNVPIPITCKPLVTDDEYKDYLAYIEDEVAKLETRKQKLKNENELLKKEQQKYQREFQLQLADAKQKVKESLQTGKSEDSESGSSSVIESSAEENEITSKKDELLEGTEEDDDLDALLTQTVGNNKQLKELWKNTLDNEMKRYTQNSGKDGIEKPDKASPIKIKLVHSLSDLEKYLKEAQEEADDISSKLSVSAKFEDGKLASDEDIKENGGLDNNKSFEEDDDSIQEFEEGLKEIDLSKVKSLAKSNKDKLLKLKQQIKKKVQDQFEDIVEESKEELGLSKEDSIVDKREAFLQMAKTLNVLLSKLEKTEEDIKKVDSEIDALQKNKKIEKDNDEISTDPGTKNEEEKEDLMSDVQPPEASDDILAQGPLKLASDSVKVRVSKVSKGDMAVREKESSALENEVKKELMKAGLNVGGANIQVKIITAGYVGDDEKVHILSDEESKSFKDMIISILEGEDDANRENKRQDEMQETYDLVWGKRSKKRPQL